MAGKLFIKTHGCQMNEYDSDKMADVLAASHGLELTDCEDEADVILVNTCSIREKAQEKVFSQLGRWKKLKRDNPGLVIGVGDGQLNRVLPATVLFGKGIAERGNHLLEVEDFLLSK